MNELGEQCAALDSSLVPLFKEAADLTDYAVLFRYLDAPREPDEAEASVALETALQGFPRSQCSPRAADQGLESGRGCAVP